MVKNIIKYILWVMFFLLVLSFILNSIWSDDGPRWPYWASSFLFSGALSITGLIILIFPKSIMQLLVKEDSLDEIQRWRFVLIGCVLSIPFFWAGITMLTIMVRRWSIECLDITKCI